MRRLLSILLALLFLSTALPVREWSRVLGKQLTSVAVNDDDDEDEDDGTTGDDDAAGKLKKDFDEYLNPPFHQLFSGRTKDAKTIDLENIHTVPALPVQFVANIPTPPPDNSYLTA